MTEHTAHVTLNAERASSSARPQRNRLVLRAIARQPTRWLPSEAKVALNVVMDAAIIEAPPPENARISYSHVVVIDNFFDEEQRQQLQDAITHSGWDHRQGPPEDKWERRTCDGANLPPTWGLKTSVLDSLASGDVDAVTEIQSRLCMLYPEYDIVHLPSEAMQAHGLGNSPPSSPSQPPQSGSSRMFDCCSILANAAVVGDAFQWHIDADPAAMPPSTWTATFGDYCNGEPGKPLLVSLLLYLNDTWPRHFDAETLFLDCSEDVGILVRPKPYRAVLMDQDVLHRLSAPSLQAGLPRYSLVWKLAFVPKKPGQKCCLSRWASQTEEQRHSPCSGCLSDSQQSS
mmetsp:Transcript_11050/g.27900  ORF Transcript_11050/g.27900 Transcript_11050/m.27900 type:complete len:344 (+) Transcript_11050:177-1208(+)